MAMTVFWARSGFCEEKFFSDIEKMVSEKSRSLLAEDTAVFAVKFADFKSFRDDVDLGSSKVHENSSIAAAVTHLYGDDDNHSPDAEMVRYLVGRDPSGSMVGAVIGDKRIEEMVAQTEGFERANIYLSSVVVDHVSIFGVDPVENAFSVDSYALANIANKVVSDDERARSAVWSILLGRLTFGMNDFSLKSEHVEMLEEMEKNRDKTLLSLVDAVRANLPEVTGEYLSEPDLPAVDAVAVHESAEIMRAHIADEWRRRHRNCRP